VRIDVIESHQDSKPETWHMEKLTFASHTGSHVDAPLHKISGGASLDGIPLERWQGPAHLLDFRGIAAGKLITAAMLAEKIPDPAILRDAFCLLATGWGQKRAHTPSWLTNAPQLGPDGAQWLVDAHARAVGIDHYSIGDGQTHAVLLGATSPVLIIEELHFPAEIFSVRGALEFWALPIHLRGHSGAPCRPVVVIRESS
jgi:kynurenine formamidase